MQLVYWLQMDQGETDPPSVSPCLAQMDPPGRNGSLGLFIDDSNFDARNLF